VPEALYHSTFSVTVDTNAETRTVVIGQSIGACDTIMIIHWITQIEFDKCIAYIN
jgi:hypothetical protein